MSTFQIKVPVRCAWNASTRCTTPANTIIHEMNTLTAIAATPGAAMANMPNTTNATPHAIDQPDACRIRSAGDSTVIATVPPKPDAGSTAPASRAKIVVQKPQGGENFCNGTFPESCALLLLYRRHALPIQFQKMRRIVLGLRSRAASLKSHPGRSRLAVARRHGHKLHQVERNVLVTPCSH